MNIQEGETQELVSIALEPYEKSLLPYLLEEGFVPGAKITVLKKYPNLGKWVIALNNSLQIAIEDRLAEKLITSPNPSQ